jgi:hypothetical protein
VVCVCVWRMQQVTTCGVCVRLEDVGDYMWCVCVCLEDAAGDYMWCVCASGGCR